MAQGTRLVQAQYETGRLANRQPVEEGGRPEYHEGAKESEEGIRNQRKETHQPRHYRQGLHPKHRTTSESGFAHENANPMPCQSMFRIYLNFQKDTFFS